jgi:hypothetical protein
MSSARDWAARESTGVTRLMAAELQAGRRP